MNHPVIELERVRCRALAAGDLDRVAALCSSRLVYVHAPGEVHGRDAFLRFLREAVRFSTVERRGLRLDAAGDVAWTTGLLRYQGHRLPAEQPFVAVSFVTQVWRHGAQGWQLEVCQSTRVDEAAWTTDPESFVTS